MFIPNRNVSITRIAIPEQLLPVLITAEGKDKTGEISWGIGVRRIVRADLDLFFRNRKQFEIKFGKYGRLDEQKRKRLRFAVELANAIAARNLPQLKKALVLLYGDKIGKSSLPLYGQQPLRSLVDSFNPVLTDTRLCIWWSSMAQRLLWGVHCHSIEAALYVLALSEVGDIGAIGRCKRCKELFFRVRPRKKYCSDRCQAAEGMRRKRERERKGTK